MAIKSISNRVNILQYRTANQQSYVRTDFTLKYLHLEDELNKCAFFKVMGSQSAVFIRSWVDYAANNDMLVLPWFNGQLEQIQLAYFAKNELADANPVAFSDFIDQLASPVVITVDLLAVDIAEFIILTNHVKKYNDAIKANANEVVALKQGSSFQRISIVIYIKDESALNLVQQSALIEFKASLFVGEVDINIAKTSSKGHASKFVALAAATGFCVILWLNQAAVASFFTGKPVEQPQSDELTKAPLVLSNAVSTALVNVEQGVMLLAVSDEDLIDKTEPTDEISSEVEVVMDSQLLSLTTIDTQEAVKEELVNSIVQEGIAAVQDESSNSESFAENTTQSNDVATESENSQFLNISSVIDDQPNANSSPATDEQKITILIDSWINGWQEQDFTAYSESYSDAYSAKKGMSHQQWLEWRKKRIEQPKWIKLSRSELSFLQDENNSSSFSLSFTLNYSSPNYKDKTLKRLSVNNIDGDYKIVVEENLKVTRVK